MFEDVTQQTIDLLNRMPANGALSKTTISTSLAASGLNAFDLRGPAVSLYPVLTPLRNTLPRELSQQGDTATRWKAITAVNTGIVTAGVQEGRRGGEISVTEQDFVATYAGLGLEASINWEAVWAGGKVFDNKATLTRALLNSVMIAEEMVLLGGNASLTLAPPAAPVLGTSGNPSANGTITPQACVVQVVALTLEGLRLATGAINGQGLQPVLAGTTIKSSVSRTNIDGTTTVFNGGASQVSPNSNTVTTTAGNQTLPAIVAAVKGAVGYAWFLGTSGNTKLAAITTTNSVVLTDNPVSTQLASVFATDFSPNATEFDGFLTLAAKPGSGAYFKSLDGAPLHSDGANGITEIDAALQSFWDNARLSPNEIWIHSQEARNINIKIINAGTSSLVRFTTQQANEPFIMGGTSVAKYWNKFTAQWIDINIHPTMPAGTILFKTNEIPYPMAEVGAVNLVRCRRDYYQIEWPFVSRQYVYGVYSDEVLVCRAPLSLGVIANIGNG